MDPFSAAMALLRRELGAREIVGRAVRLYLPASRATPRVVALIGAILAAHAGPRPVMLRLCNGERSATLALPWTVRNDVIAPLTDLLGERGVTE